MHERMCVCILTNVHIIVLSYEPSKPNYMEDFSYAGLLELNTYEVTYEQWDQRMRWRQRQIQH